MRIVGAPWRKGLGTRSVANPDPRGGSDRCMRTIISALVILMALLIGGLAYSALAGWQWHPLDTSPHQNPTCEGQKLLAAGGISVWKLGGGAAVFFVAGMTIDADGSPRAYHPENTGLDDLENARGDGGWAGIVLQDGEPVVQGPADPAPGYYVSQTALEDWTKRATDPNRYVDSEKVPFIVLPGDVARMAGARVGDFAMVRNLRNGRSCAAIFADMGPGLGEGSIALARALGINPDARRGGTYRGVLYIVFPHSGNRRPGPVEEINDAATRLLTDCGGLDRINCSLEAAKN